MGQRLGKYRLRRRIARGGFAEVFEARDSIERVSVAFKVPIALNEPEAIREFMREVRRNATLDHPNILPLKNADVWDGLPFAVFPLGEESLLDRLQRRISTGRALDYGLQLLDGLGYTHQRDLVHCDVKPENVILFSEHRVRLADFGLAKTNAQARLGSNSGTLEYMAPEHLEGTPSMRSDVFSAGLVLYQMLAGHVPQAPFRWPFEGHERLESDAPELVPVLRRALTVEPGRRYADARSLARAVRRAIALRG